jgi:rRNA-processing protein FCF1
MSIVDINNHINRCSDAQFRIKMPKVQPELTKLKLDKKGNVITRENASGESARAEKLEVLKSGTMKEAFQDLLMKHLDS